MHFNNWSKKINLSLDEGAPSLYLDKQVVSIGIVWLFHLSAIIGITLGFFDFFAPKTPLNLSIIFILLIWVYPLASLKKMLLVGFFFASGMLVEYLGVNFGLLFGSYAYGENLGLKFQGVPWLIGINWAVLVLITGSISNVLKVGKFAKVVIGAALMIILDLPMEVAAPIFDFWEFSGGVAPLQNYLAWFTIAAILHAVFQWSGLKGDARFSLHIYACQFLFFTYFCFYYGF